MLLEPSGVRAMGLWFRIQVQDFFQTRGLQYNPCVEEIRYDAMT